MRKFPERAGGLLSYFTRHRTAANLLLVILVAAGLLAAPNMRAQFFPDVIVDEIDVSVAWDGAGAEDVDAAIVQVLEPVLLSVEGVVSSEARSTEGRARIGLEFEPNWDMGRAADDVQQAVDSVSTLPEAADDPTVTRGGWRDRVTDVVVTGPVGAEQLGNFVDEFVTRLFAEGVTRTTIRGIASPETLIEVPSAHLVKYDITMSEIAAAIAREVDADPAGDVTGANARVRTGVEKRTPEQIEAIVLRTEADGSALTVADVGTVSVGAVTRERTYFVGDNPAMSVRVDRSDQGDAIEIQRQVEEVAEKMMTTLPEGVRIDLIRTRAEAITDRLDLLVGNGLVGLALVVTLLFLFLNVRTAIWVAAGIPVAMLAALAFMYTAGLTINMISLFALIITLGIVVDDAIVVGEHADARVRRYNEGPVVAAETAARRMALPVFSSTLTTIIAFYGLTVISGRFGEMIADIPFTVIVVLSASLIECFLILPNHMSHALAHSGKDHWYDWPSRKVNTGFVYVRERLFRPFMRAVVTFRYPVLALCIFGLAATSAMIVRGDVTWRFFSGPEQNSISGNFAMVSSATRDDTLEMMREMQRAADAVAQRYEDEHGISPVSYVVSEIGGNTGRGLSGADTKDTDQLGSIAIELIDVDDRPGYPGSAFIADLQSEIRQHPLAETVSFRGWRGGPGGDALDVEFYGADLETLKAASEALKEALVRYPEVSAVEDSLSYDKEEMILELTPQGQVLGYTTDDLGRVLRNRLNGIEAATYPSGPRSAEIRVELPAGELTADFLDRMMIRSPSGEYVALADIVRVERRTGFSTVRRENGLRLLNVTGDIADEDAARAEEIMLALEQDILPQISSDYQVEYRLGGLSEQENEFLADARFGLMMVLLGIYLVLAWVFSSWTRPVVVMSIIPFGLVGAVWGHYIWDVPLSMFTVVGFLGMVGIIINDSIVLVTTIDEYAEERGLFPSIVDGAADRLRPVMLTTLTTVLGLAPLLYEQSSQAQFLKPTVITLCYGLGFGMVLVLMVVPALMAIQRDVGALIAAFKRGMGFRAEHVRRGMQAAFVAVLAWLGATFGVYGVTGALPYWPEAGAGMVFALFAAGVMVAALLAFVVIYAVNARRRRRVSALHAAE